MSICSIPQCDKKINGNGYCFTHNYAYKKSGDPLSSREYISGGGTGICSVDGCATKVRAKNLCATHLSRYTKYGSPLITKHAPPGSGHIDKRGYKRISANGKECFEHRYIMEQYLGRKLTSNEEVHHLDGNKINNNISNLIVLSKSDHAKLHAYLDKVLDKLTGVFKICLICGDSFYVPHCRAERAKACSPACRARLPRK